MKKVTSIVAAAFIAATLTTSMDSCKKGANDPLISLKSRDSRITGVWTLTSSDETTTYITSTGGVSSTSVTTTTYNGSIKTETVSSGGTSLSSSSSYSLEVTIEKDGTYSMTEIEDGSTDISTGSWWWMDSRKNKSGIVFDGVGSNIDQLKNKELILIENTYSKSSSGGGDFSETTGTSTSTYTKS